jgi:hypothetical protein
LDNQLRARYMQVNLDVTYIVFVDVGGFGKIGCIRDSLTC